ncbi:NIPSNAP family protein [Pseudohalocynthiibacter aestuariivivens]|uniref:NIPSNAP family protein n=1 Tax=Pseudohalocynthiibacter aestuariivivens TaxID=1591409 RepID=A0ABV5JCQ9_9RHOB|nr:NIPSNAP family protein [Pseudohalocynthiibacter aestuariivivens]MBS9717263.1 NIPSNAP family protein [Pseudohalocynthiibacter aestuariivivens]
MSIYEFATLQTKTSAAPMAAEVLEKYLHSPHNLGQLLGCWISEIGALNRVALLRRYQDKLTHDTERQILLTSNDPFGCGSLLIGMTLDRCAPFPNVPEIDAGHFGPFYEIRTYEMETGGLAPTLETWAKAIPIRAERSKLVTVLHTVEGAPKMVSVWPYPSIEDRQVTRKQAINDGIWPPIDSFKHLKTEMLSTLYLPTSFSPLQ